MAIHSLTNSDEPVLGTFTGCAGMGAQNPTKHGLHSWACLSKPSATKAPLLHFWLDPALSLIQPNWNAHFLWTLETCHHCVSLSFFLCCCWNPSWPHSGDPSSYKPSWLTQPAAQVWTEKAQGRHHLVHPVLGPVRRVGLNCPKGITFLQGSSSTFSFFFFFLFYGCTCSIWKFPGSGVQLELQLGPISQPWQHQIRATSVTYTAACGNAVSLTPWARPGIESTPHGYYVGFLTHWATTGTSAALLSNSFASRIVLSIPLGAWAKSCDLGKAFIFTFLKVPVTSLVWRGVKAMNLSRALPSLQGPSSHGNFKYILKKNRLYQNIPVSLQTKQVSNSL